TLFFFLQLFIKYMMHKSKNNKNQLTNPVMKKEDLISAACTVTIRALKITQNFEDFAPVIKTFLKIGIEIIELYEKAKHNKELCGFLLKRCNCATAAVKDLDIRKTENRGFFSEPENLKLLGDFNDCMKKIKEFILRVSKLNKLIKYLFANSIE